MKKIIEEFIAKGLKASDIKLIEQVVGNNISKFKRLAQRRLFGEPLAYLFNEITFLGHKFFIDKRVYVPNPETEGMVKILLNKAGDNSTIIDVGCGSGAIGISLKLLNKNLKIHGVDIDPGALEVARLNAKRLGVKIKFKESFYVDDLDISSPDYIISDLPYGDQSYTLPSINLEEFYHMPKVALFHPTGPLEAYRELIESILKKGWKTTLIFESGRIGKEKVSQIIPSGISWKYLELKKDYSVTLIYLTS